MDGLPEEGFTPRLVDSYWSKRPAAKLTDQGLAGRYDTYNDSMGGLQAQSCEHGRSSYLQKSGGLVSGPHG